MKGRSLLYSDYMYLSYNNIFFYIPPLSSVHCIIFPLSFFHFFFTFYKHNIKFSLHFQMISFLLQYNVTCSIKKGNTFGRSNYEHLAIDFNMDRILIIWMAKTLLIQFIQSCMYVFKWSCIFLQIFLYYRA